MLEVGRRGLFLFVAQAGLDCLNVITRFIYFFCTRFRQHALTGKMKRNRRKQNVAVARQECVQEDTLSRTSKQTNKKGVREKMAIRHHPMQSAHEGTPSGIRAFSIFQSTKFVQNHLGHLSEAFQW